MSRCRQGAVRFLGVLVASGALALGPGCDWLQGSDSVGRSSPYLSSLTVSRSSVLCGKEFVVSFRYDDPQGDLYEAKIYLQHTEEATLLDKSEVWPEDISPSAGTADFTLSFDCDDPGGRWRITVSAEDDEGHKSNTLTGNITLSSAG